jgi:hypothetical protein
LVSCSIYSGPASCSAFHFYLSQDFGLVVHFNLLSLALVWLGFLLRIFIHTFPYKKCTAQCRGQQVEVEGPVLVLQLHVFS